MTMKKTNPDPRYRISLRHRGREIFACDADIFDVQDVRNIFLKRLQEVIDEPDAPRNYIDMLQFEITRY